jgi:mannan endo-1,4-beta-mannosidase
MTETTLARLKNGQILTLSWHWNAPKDLIDKTYKDKDGKTVDAQWYKGFYTYATTFDVQRALANPQSEDYRLLLRDIDVIAVELKKYAAANVPILWRPLHEAEGGWFWWGAKGPGPFVQLWKLLYDRLVNRHQLHNLIWVYTTGSKTEWYPGDAYVDVLGVDAYPGDVTDPLSNDWESLLKRYDGKKLLAITEFGGVPDVERMKRFGVRWSYFVSWTGDLGPKKISKEALKRIYQSAEVINLP